MYKDKGTSAGFKMDKEQAQNFKATFYHDLRQRLHCHHDVNKLNSHNTQFI